MSKKRDAAPGRGLIKQASVLQALGLSELTWTGPIRETACVTAWSPDSAQLI